MNKEKRPEKERELTFYTSLGSSPDTVASYSISQVKGG